MATLRLFNRVLFNICFNIFIPSPPRKTNKLATLRLLRMCGMVVYKDIVECCPLPLLTPLDMWYSGFTAVSHRWSRRAVHNKWKTTRAHHGESCFFWRILENLASESFKVFIFAFLREVNILEIVTWGGGGFGGMRGSTRSNSHIYQGEVRCQHLLTRVEYRIYMSWCVTNKHSHHDNPRPERNNLVTWDIRIVWLNTLIRKFQYIYISTP